MNLFLFMLVSLFFHNRPTSLFFTLHQLFFIFFLYIRPIRPNNSLLSLFPLSLFLYHPMFLLLSLSSFKLCACLFFPFNAHLICYLCYQSCYVDFHFKVYVNLYVYLSLFTNTLDYYSFCCYI